VVKSRKIQFLNKQMFSGKLPRCDLDYKIVKKLHFQNNSGGKGPSFGTAYKFIHLCGNNRVLKT